MYKAILFDLDGTLTDSGEGITKSVQYALEKVGKPEPDLQKLRIFVGPPLLEQFQEYAGIDEETARKAVEIYRERYAPVGIYENELYPGIPEMLSGLKQRGYKLAIASSKPENFVKIVAEYFHIDSYFDEMVGSEPEGRRTNKTEVIEETLKRLGFSEHRDQVIMVGDKEHDVFGARRAGLECIAVSYGYGTEEELKNAHPFKIVNSAEKILIFSPEPQKKTENAGFGMEVSVSGGNPFCAFPACLLSGTVFSGAADWRRYECILPACAYADWSDRDSGCSSLHIVVSGRFFKKKRNRDIISCS